MHHQRLVARAVAGVITSIALVSGTGLVQAAQADTMTAAQHCRAERQDVAKAQVKVKKAKKGLKKAKKAHKPARVKKATKQVKKAKRNLQRQKSQRAHWCGKARAEAQATKKGEDTRSGYDDVRNDAQPLPPALRTAVESAAAAAQAAVDGLLAQVPGASPETLAQVLAQLEALDPTALEEAIAGLTAQLQTVGGDHDAALAALLELLADPTAGTPVPSSDGLGALQTALQGALGALASFDPATGTGSVAGLTDAVKALTDRLATDQGTLGTLLDTLAGSTGNPLPTDPTGLLDVIGSTVSGGGSGATAVTGILGPILGGLFGH